MKKLFSFILLVTIFTSCAHNSNNQNVSILPVSKVNWEKLNKARGDKSPQAGTLWGDRKGSPATGFLAKFVDGFSSPPHIHNVSYRAIVIEGLVHNDDPKAANMWMPKGSYWTQPAGEAHITSAKGKVNIALVEIDNGPYLVKPTKQKFDNGERPYNIHASNIIWREQGSYKSVDLWKNKSRKVTGSLLRFRKSLNLETEESKLVVVKGEISINDHTLKPGSLITVPQKSEVKVSCKANDCILYLKSDEKYKVL